MSEHHEPDRMKAAWEIRAGVIPKEPMPEYTKRFIYTERDYEEDREHDEDLGFQPMFVKQMACAMAYYQQMNNPQMLNWADITFIWY